MNRPDLNLSAPVGLPDPTLAFNLATPTDYSAGCQFLNLMEVARSWIGHKPNQWGGMTTSELVAGGYLDAQGWPTSIPEGFASIGTLWQWHSQPDSAAEYAGVYVLTYDGDGTIVLEGDARVIEAQPGRIVFRNVLGHSLYLKITATNPANHIRNIAIVAEEHVALYQASGIFNPAWLALIEDARILRFMDWNATNNATVVEWEDRRAAGTLIGVTKGDGVPVEYMVALANQTGADPWFNIPHTASDKYVASFAAYVRDHLDPARVARVEFSNEAWNGSFKQYGWLRQQAQARWGIGSGSVPNNYYTKRASEVARIWNDTFGAADRNRLVHVLAGQTVNSWLTNEMLTAPAWRKAEPDAWVDPTTTFDEFAVTTYFGSQTVSVSHMRQELLDVLNTPSIDPFEWLTGKLSDPAYEGSVPSTIERLAAQKAVVSRAGLRLMAYEGGQHVHHSFAVPGLTEEQLARLNNFLAQFVRSKQMGKLYRDLWAAWSRIGDGPFMQFGELGIASRWGSWGLYTAPTDTSARAEALEELNASTPSWWAHDGRDFRQGVTVQGTGGTLTGTVKSDYLIGGDGDDVLIGGPGDDGLHGGAGTDRVVLSGTAAEYSIQPEGNGYRLVGPDGSDFIIDVEEIAFSDGQVLTVAQMLEGPRQKAEATIGARGMLANAAGAQMRVVDADETGVTVDGVNFWSALGQESGQGNHYVINKNGAVATFAGQTVPADYWSQQENRNGRTGALLTEAATRSALELGSILKDAGALTLTAGNDRFFGRTYDDHIDGGAGNDRLSGGSGNDTLRSGGGDDTLIGGPGRDLFGVDAGTTRIEDFTRDDSLDLSGFGPWHSLAHGVDARGHLWLSNGTDKVTFVGLTPADLDWIGGCVRA